MAGIRRFKLSDALPKPLAESSRSARGGKKKAKAGEAGSAESTAAEQARQIHEASLAKNAEASTRDRMVDIGRGNLQAGRQRSGGSRGK